MHSQLVLFVAFAFIGYTLSAAVQSAPRSLDSASLTSSPERRNDLLINAEEPQPEADSLAEGAGSDLESSATHHRGYRRAYYGGYYGGYGGYGGYPYGGYSSYSSYPSYGYGYGGYPGYYGGYGHHGYGHRRGYYY